jgi:hypothetical protein
MTKHEANRLLDRHKETKELSYLDTTRALAITGDYEEHGSEGVDFEIQEEIPRDWDSGSFYMVVEDIARYSQKTWDTSNQRFTQTNEYS